MAGSPAGDDLGTCEGQVHVVLQVCRAAGGAGIIWRLSLKTSARL